MPKITIFNNQGHEYKIPLDDAPVRIGNGNGCDLVLPGLPADGPLLEVKTGIVGQKPQILIAKLNSGCETLLNGKPLGDGAEVWAHQAELKIGTYRFHHDLADRSEPVANDGFRVTVDQANRDLLLTPGEARECLVTVSNPSARKVNGTLAVTVDGRTVNWVAGAGKMGQQFKENENREIHLHFKAPRTLPVKDGGYRVAITASSMASNFSPGSDSISLKVEPYRKHTLLRPERLFRFNPLLGLVFRAARFSLKVSNEGNCTDDYTLNVEPEQDSDERTECKFVDTEDIQAQLHVEPGKKGASQLLLKPPLLWFPPWRGHRFIASADRTNVHANDLLAGEYRQADSNSRPFRFTQLSVIWLVLIIAGLGWLGWQGFKMWRTPEFQQMPGITLGVNREGGNPDDPIKAGEPVTVTWDAPYASVVDIYQVGENGALKEIVKNHNAGEKKFTISSGFEKTVKLRVIARNSFGQAEKDIEVPINFVPARVQFNPTSPVRIVLDPASGGQSAGIKIGWVVEGKAISGVTFDGESVEKNDSRYKYPTAPTTYDLVVNYSNGQPSLVRKFEVIVITPTPTPPPSPTPSPTPPRCDPSNQFNVIWPEGSGKAAKRPATAIKKGDGVMLAWDVKGADSVRIMQDEGSGSSLLSTGSQVSGSVPISPQRKTTYTLILVKSGQEVVCKSVAVAVKCRYGRKTPPFYEWRDCQ